MQFTKHRDLQVKVFKNNAAYLGSPSLRPDAMHLTPENSRRFRALPAWFTVMAYGKQGYTDLVERNCAAASALGERIEKSGTFILLAPVRLNVVCFTFKNENFSSEDIRSFLEKIRDDGQVFFTPTVYKDRAAIRAAISNWQTTLNDIDIAFNILQALAHIKQ